MSLDVYLEADVPPTQPTGGSGIFIRRNGQAVELSRDEWDRAFPGQEPVVVTAEAEVNTNVYSGNITHNLTKMAAAAGLYDCMWRPEEHSMERASDLIEPLRKGLSKLMDAPDEFKKHNPPNGWGDYDGLVRFGCDYLEACLKYPNAKVRVSR